MSVITKKDNKISNLKTDIEKLRASIENGVDDESHKHIVSDDQVSEIVHSKSENNIHDACVAELTLLKKQLRGSRRHAKKENCKSGICEVDEDDKKLLCQACKRLFHYSCTELPLYQLSQFLVKGYRKYICANCTDIPEYIREALASQETHNEIVMSVPQLINTSVQTAPDDNKVGDDSEKSQQGAFDQTGNPDNLVKLKQYMKKELVQMGKSIKESLVKEIQENNKKIEERLSFKQSLTGPWHLQGVDGTNEDEATMQSTSQAATPVDFRSIIQEQQKQQIDEVNDQRSRARNIIIHGVQEDADADRTQTKKK